MQPESTGELKAFALVNARVALNESRAPNLGAGRPTAILIEDGRIAHVGDDDTVRELLHRGQAIDVHGAVIAPGLVDAHIHAFDCGVASLHVSCLPPEVDSLAALKRRLTDRAASRPLGAWVVGTGYDDTRLREHRHPSCLDLDSAVPHHPAVVGRACGHISVANTLALTSAGIDRATSDPPGGTIVRDATGAPTGLLLETAQDLVWPGIAEQDAEARGNPGTPARVPVRRRRGLPFTPRPPAMPASLPPPDDDRAPAAPRTEFGCPGHHLGRSHQSMAWHRGRHCSSDVGRVSARDHGGGFGRRGDALLHSKWRTCARTREQGRDNCHWEGRGPDCPSPGSVRAR